MPRIHNFIGLEMEVAGQKDLKAEIEEKYGLPTNEFNLYLINDKHFIVLSTSKEISDNAGLIEMPNKLAELGCPKERFNFWSNKVNELNRIESSIFPYTFKSAVPVDFKDTNIQPGVEPEILLEILTEHEKDKILHNLDEYIKYYFKLL